METAKIASKKPNILTPAILALSLVLGMAFIIAAIPSSTVTYQWIVFLFLAATPTQIIVGIFWNNNLPFIKGLDKKSQPLKGIVLTCFSGLMGFLVASFSLLVLGKGISAPTPQLVHFLIIAIIIMIWFAIVVNFWPFVNKIKNSTLIGISTLVTVYLLAFLVWNSFFDYTSVAGLAPWYSEILDPKGIYDFVPAIVFIITTCPIILYLSLFDGWLLDRWNKGKQPGKMIMNTIIVLLISLGFQWFFSSVLGMDLMVYMVMVPVCMVFGVFVVNNLTRFMLFEDMGQPFKGIYKMIVATLVGFVMYMIYYNVADFLTGIPMASGREGNYQLDLWIADTMLGVSFPLIIIITGFFNFWPILRNDKTK